MAKVGLDYFELDCHLEEKVKLIQAEFGLKGFAIVVKLYQKIYGEFGYYCEWSDDSLLLFMSENGIPSCSEKNLIKEIVSACIRRNIFSKELFDKFGILTSYGVQKRYAKATSRREEVEMKKEYLLLSDGEINKNVVINENNVNRNAKNVNRNKQSRVEKSRVEESRVEKNKAAAPPQYYPDELLNQAFLDYMEMRKKVRKPMTERAVTLAMNKLRELSTVPFSDSMDNDVAIKILEQSTMNCWQGLFPLKNNTTQKQNNNVFDEWRNA